MFSSARYLKTIQFTRGISGFFTQFEIRKFYQLSLPKIWKIQVPRNSNQSQDKTKQKHFLTY